MPQACGTRAPPIRFIARPHHTEFQMDREQNFGIPRVEECVSATTREASGEAVQMPVKSKELNLCREQ